MAGKHVWVPLVLAWAAMQLGACRPPVAPDQPKSEPAKIEVIAGTDRHRVTLTEAAAGRLGIQTALVRRGPVVGGRERAQEESENTVVRTIIPYSAVFYDALGKTWTYTTPQTLTFVREPISVDFIDGNSAMLLAGPPPDTAVVTVGAPELYGAEFGVGH
jgi:hypothetical protein